MPTILIIDDEQALRDEVSDWLQFEGYTVISAENGRVGLEMVLREKPDLIICDIAMPEMDGRTLLLEVRSDQNLSEIPFIFLTASATYESMRGGMNLGADDYLTKPFKHTDLLNAIASRLQKREEQQRGALRQLDVVHKSLKEEQERRLLKSRLVAMVSHDFRNPLLSILSSAELIEHYGDKMDGERKLKYLHRIGGSVRLLLQMLDDLLIAAEIEGGHLAYHPQEVDVAYLLEEIIDEFQMIYGDHHEFVFEKYFVDLTMIDPKLLRQIATNLISNAVKYSPRGTAVTVRLLSTSSGFALHVNDEGRGIPEKDLENLFDAFYRVEHAKVPTGTGLGLSIAQASTTLCGGSIHVTSEVGKGSSFVVEFPRSTPQ